MALTIRTTESQDELIAKLCKRLDINTASKLFLHLLESYESVDGLISTQEHEINELMRNLRQAKSTIISFQTSFSDLMGFKS